jgi:hypothetical protein
MRHARAAALDALEDLLIAIRARGVGVKETARGVFYRKGKAWLHFHEDGAVVFADIRFGDEWERLGVNDAAERAALLDFVDRQL